MHVPACAMYSSSWLKLQWHLYVTSQTVSTPQSICQHLTEPFPTMQGWWCAESLVEVSFLPYSSHAFPPEGFLTVQQLNCTFPHTAQLFCTSSHAQKVRLPRLAKSSLVQSRGPFHVKAGFLLAEQSHAATKPSFQLIHLFYNDLSWVHRHPLLTGTNHFISS